ncbi:hypothetical protein GCK32_011980 [Trichostrongylus colubriformis]|uniref:Uncharacterized protein n=1 Tax=Trichostrongylus colubriformis TaxID=6319 RepID=A0AAN8FFT1_TRICO
MYHMLLCCLPVVKRQMTTTFDGGDMHSAKELEALEAEVASVIRQVAVWTMELEEVNASRLEIEIRFLQLGSELKKSVTCVQLASIDFELIQMRHNERWRRFLADHVPPEKLLTLSKVPS